MTRATWIAAVLACARAGWAQPSPSEDSHPQEPSIPTKADPEKLPKPPTEVDLTPAKKVVPAPVAPPDPRADPPLPPPVLDVPAPPDAPPPMLPPFEVAPRPTDPDDDAVTSEVFRPRYHFDLQWRAMMLPLRLIELALLPLALLVAVVDEHTLDVRLGQLLEVVGGHTKLSPRFKFTLSDGLGIGVTVESPPMFANRARLRAGGLVRLNGDWQTELEYRHALLLPGGRGFRARVYVDRDKNQRYYGIGGATPVTNERVLRSNEVGAFLDIDLQGVDRYTYSGLAGLGLRRQTLSAGTEAGQLPVGGENDAVAPPPKFGEATTYVDALLLGHYDTRDALGRPSRGTLLEAKALARIEVMGKHLSGLTLSGSASQLLPVLPEHRVLVLSLGGAAAVPLFSGRQLPLDSLAVVGRTNDRGYDRNRFQDRFAMTATIEYRFPVYEYLASRAGLDAFAFADAGTAWGRTKFTDLPIHYSVGGGLRAGSQNDVVFEMIVGWSPDGPQISLGLENLL